MNRIVLIGNGFDLAHGLPTGYVDFINNYWEDFHCHVLNGYAQYLLKHFGVAPIKSYSDNFADLKVINKGSDEITEFTVTDNEQNAFNEWCRFINDYNQVGRFTESLQLTFKNPFWKHISAQASLENWVDIENEYFQSLNRLIDQERDLGYKSAKELNIDFHSIQNLLIEYLRKIQEEKISDELFNEGINKIIFESINQQDISKSGQDLFLEDISSQLFNSPGGMCLGEIEDELRIHPEYEILGTREDSFRVMVENKINKGQLKDFLIPNQILLLNFNYTNTAKKLYVKSDHYPKCELIHIHGELDDKNNPIIFGYGDEMHEDYKKIVDLNNNAYLENIKSIRYLETDNYRRLLGFIDSAPYQIYIMGHSCGNSDRTLLNTLFEHKNCLSIKPYYYLREDGTDNYIDIVQNISRDFKDMTLMRDRVVNKCYCQPLVTP
ncbi:AbiH family protein [uncultured Alistipes sp.]|uniref:AbiH family protein n=1 Tax=uncultured Alistipes sp. TaxID=538949 RepID=UPI003207F977